MKHVHVGSKPVGRKGVCGAYVVVGVCLEGVGVGNAE